MKKLIYIFLLIPSLLSAQKDINGKRLYNKSVPNSAMQDMWDGKRAVKVTDWGVIVDDSTVYDANRTAIINALNYADANGYKNVEFPSGNIWTDSITVLHDSLNFIGAGGTWLYYKGADQGESRHVRFLVLSKRKDIHIDGINFKCYNSRQTPYQVFPIFIYNAVSETGYAENISVEHCIFEDFGSIYAGGGYTDTVSIALNFSHNVFRNNTVKATAFYNGRGIDSPGCFASQFNYNYFYGNWLINGAFRDYFEDCRFIGNYIEKTEDSSFYIRGNKNVIAFNIIYYPGKDGIKVLETDLSPWIQGYGNIITGNQVHGAGATYGKDSATMIKAEGKHSIISNNIAYAVDTTGVSPHWSLLDQKGFQCRGDSMLVTGNYAFGGYSKGWMSYSGIAVTGNSGNAVITNNYIYDWNYGISSIYGHNFVMSGNVIKNSGNKGIVMNSYDVANRCNKVVITNNIFYNSASDDISVRYADSIYVAGNISFNRAADDFLDIADCQNVRYGINQDMNSTDPPAISSFTVPVGDSISVGGADFIIDQADSFVLGIGYGVLAARKGMYKTAFGYQSLGSDTVDGSCSVGHQTLRNNSGAFSCGLGYRTGQYNTGGSLFAGAYYAGMYNSGNNSILIGVQSGRWNKGDYSNGYGYFSLQTNTGSYCNAFGGLALNRNEGDYNTALGYDSFNTFYDNTGGAKTFDYTDIITTGNDTITITGHSFGSADEQVILKYTQGTSAITGLTSGSAYPWKIIDANTLCGGFTQNITAAGTGTGHTFTPQTSLTNSTALGYNAEPDASNQVKLGNTSVTSVKSSGTLEVPAFNINSSNATTTKIDTMKTAGGTIRWLKITTGGSTFWCPADTSIVK